MYLPLEFLDRDALNREFMGVTLKEEHEFAKQRESCGRSRPQDSNYSSGPLVEAKILLRNHTVLGKRAVSVKRTHVSLCLSKMYFLVKVTGYYLYCLVEGLV